MKKYPKYKPSVVEGIKEIPDYWETYKLKYLVDTSKYYQIGDGDHGSIKPEMYSNEGNIPYIRVQNLSWNGDLKWEGMVYISKEHHFANLKSRIVPKDILIAKTGATIGKLALIPDAVEEANTTSSVGKISVDQERFDAKFILYAMMSRYFKDQIWIEASQKSAQPGFNIDDLIFFKIACPKSKPDQTEIANFLDEKTAKIDKLITDKQKLVELLEKERKAVIDEIVLKGVNPDAKLKHSGYDWLGNIPQHWKVTKLRYVGKCQNGISKSADYFGAGFPFISYGDVYNNDELPSNVSGLAQSSEEDRVLYSVQEGDVFFTRTSETVDEIGFSSTCMKTIPDATFSGFLIRFRPYRHKLYKGFSKYYFRSQIHRKYFVKEMNLVTRASLSQDLLKNLPILIPPLDEQKIIASFLADKMHFHDSTVSKIIKEIELLQEYRTALVNEVITGKIILV